MPPVFWIKAPSAIPSPEPAVASGNCMAYDSAREVVVLDEGGLNAIYEWNGQWKEKACGLAPTRRRHHSVAYHAGMQRIVVFGGEIEEDSEWSPTNHLWTWDGEHWERWSSSDPIPTLAPPARSRHASAYDAVHDEVLIYGGHQGDTDLWAFTGSEWVLRDTNCAPGPQQDHSMAYDPVGQALFLYGAGDVLWRWNGTWSSIPAGLGERMSPSLAYDPKRKKIVLFGGLRSIWSATKPSPSPPGALNDLFEWDGSSFQPVALGSGSIRPSARAKAALAHDGARGRMLLFGGTTTGPDFAIKAPWPAGPEPWGNDVDPGEKSASAFGAESVLHDTWSLGPQHTIHDLDIDPKVDDADPPPGPNPRVPRDERDPPPIPDPDPGPIRRRSNVE